MSKYIIITNNPLVKDKYNDKEIVFIENGKSYRDVLIKVRDYCLMGHKLLTHPLSGSVKPNETPFKSILISKTKNDYIDKDSIVLLDKSINTYDKFVKLDIEWKKSVIDDFSVVDCMLITSGIESAEHSMS